MATHKGPTVRERVLAYADEQVGAFKLRDAAAACGCTEEAARYSLRALEFHGQVERVDRQSWRLVSDVPMRDVPGYVTPMRDADMSRQALERCERKWRSLAGGARFEDANVRPLPTVRMPPPLLFSPIGSSAALCADGRAAR